LHGPGLDATLSALGLSASRDQWRPEWEASEAVAEQYLAPCLTASPLRESCAWLGLAPEITEELVKGLDLFPAHPAARRLAGHVYYTAFLSTSDPRERRIRVVTWPELPETLHPRALMFYALVLLAGLPRLKEAHARRGIPEAITRDTLADLELWMRKHHRRFGAWGFTEKKWLAWHFMDQLVTLGRLQFTLETFPSPLRAYRHRRTRQVVLMPGDGLVYRTDGQYANSTGAPDQDAWTSRFQDDGALLRGQRITPDGRAVREEVTLPADDWECVLKKDDPTLGTHIPETGPMDMARCRDSFSQALAFMPRHYPEHRFRAFTCYSWLCSNVFEQLLPGTSNIRQFAQEWYLFPVLNAGPDVLFIQLFGRTFTQWDEVPQTSSLLRAAVGHLKAGGQIHNGAGFMLPEDLDWGKAVYRSGRAANVSAIKT
jgi:hypothetical protein